MGTETHFLLDDREKVSFLPASRMKRELGFLEPKNLGRITLDKSVWREQGHQCRQKPLGPGGLAPWWLVVSVLLVRCPILSPPTCHEMLPVLGVARLYLLCPLCLFLAERLKGLRSVGQKCGGVAEYSQCPPVQWLDRLSQRASSCVLGSGTSPWGCEEARSISNSRCCLRSHSLPPNTPCLLAKLRPAGQKCRSEGPRGSGCQGRAGL